jgi:hypothetical protein
MLIDKFMSVKLDKNSSPIFIVDYRPTGSSIKRRSFVVTNHKRFPNIVDSEDYVYVPTYEVSANTLDEFNNKVELDILNLLVAAGCENYALSRFNNFDVLCGYMDKTLKSHYRNLTDVLRPSGYDYTSEKYKVDMYDAFLEDRVRYYLEGNGVVLNPNDKVIIGIDINIPDCFIRPYQNEHRGEYGIYYASMGLAVMDSSSVILGVLSEQ